MEYFCLICGNPMKVLPYMLKRGRGKFCSLACKHRFMSKHLSGRIFTEEHKRKLKEARKTQVFSEEDKRHMSEGQKRRLSDPEERIKHNALNLGRHLTKEEKAKISGSNSSGWKGGLCQDIKAYKLFKAKERQRRKRGATGQHTILEWQNLKKKYNFTCPCCLKVEPEIRLTEDHIVPLVFGGTDDIINIQPLCGICNSKKHTKIIKFLFPKE